MKISDLYFESRFQVKKQMKQADEFAVDRAVEEWDGERFRLERRLRGMTLNELAISANVSYSTLSELEREKRHVGVKIRRRVVRSILCIEDRSGDCLNRLLRRVRILKGVTLEDMAERFHFAKNTLRNYESGYCNIQKERYLKMIRALAPELYRDIAERYDSMQSTHRNLSDTSIGCFRSGRLLDRPCFYPETLIGIREKRGLTKSEFANALGISLSMISLMESGRRRWTEQTAKRIDEWAQIIGQPLSDSERKSLNEPFLHSDQIEL